MVMHVFICICKYRVQNVIINATNCALLFKYVKAGIHKQFYSVCVLSPLHIVFVSWQIK